MSDKQEQYNRVVLATATDLATAAIVEMVGNAMTNQVDGQVVTPGILTDTVAARIRARMGKKAGDQQ